MHTRIETNRIRSRQFAKHVHDRARRTESSEYAELDAHDLESLLIDLGGEEVAVQPPFDPVHVADPLHVEAEHHDEEHEDEEENGHDEERPVRQRRHPNDLADPWML